MEEHDFYDISANILTFEQALMNIVGINDSGNEQDDEMMLLPPLELIPSLEPIPSREPISSREPIPSLESTLETNETNSLSWEERCKVAPLPRTIRVLTEPATTDLWSDRDFTLTQWTALFATSQAAAEVFYKNQQKRWLAKMALNKWRRTIWMRKTQCNVDMIDMAPIKDIDAIFVTDISQRKIFRFHRHDVYSNLLSNICMSEEMMPYPRPPTNPWTNQPLTLTQIISVCEQLVTDYGRRGRCPPVLFAAFCAAKYDIDRFQRDNSSLLAQHAIVAYFKDITAENVNVVEETMTNLLSDAGLDFSPTAIRRWLRTRPMTPLHQEWLTFVQDYTLYINLHVQVRTSWTNRYYIRQDVRRLYSRTTIPSPISARAAAMTIRPSLSALQRILLPGSDISGNLSIVHMTSDQELAIQFIQNALFRF